MAAFVLSSVCWRLFFLACNSCISVYRGVRCFTQTHEFHSVMHIPGLWPLFRSVPVYVPVLLETFRVIVTINTFKIVNCSDNNRCRTIVWVSRGELDKIIQLSLFYTVKINEHIFGDTEIFSELISSHSSVCIVEKYKVGRVELFILTFPIGMSN